MKSNKRTTIDADLISKDELCAITGWTERQIRQMAREGYFPHARDRHYNTLAVMRGLWRYRGDQLEKKNQPGIVAKARLDNAKAKKIEGQAEMPRAVLSVWAAMHAIVRDTAMDLRHLVRYAEVEICSKLNSKSKTDSREIESIIGESFVKVIPQFQDKCFQNFKRHTDNWEKENPDLAAAVDVLGPNGDGSRPPPKTKPAKN